MSSIGADPGSPSAYARTKGEGERLVRAAFPAAAIMRPSIIFGAEDGFFNRFARMAQLSPALPLIGGGQTLGYGRVVLLLVEPDRVPDVEEGLIGRDARLKLGGEHRRIGRDGFEHGHDVGIAAVLAA